MAKTGKKGIKKAKSSDTLPIFKKNVAVCIIFSIVTFGIYLVYWQYKLVKNTRALRGDNKSSTAEFLLFAYVPFYHYYWFFTRGVAVKNSLKALNYPVCGDGWLYLLLDICRLGIVSIAIMQNDFNNMPVDKMPVSDNVIGFIPSSSVDKLFFSPVKEEEWLNSMAACGYVLVKRKFSGYIFAVDGYANQFYYSVCSLAAPAESEASQAIIKKRVAMGSDLIYTYGNKAYFRTPVVMTGVCAGITHDSVSKLRHLRGLLAFNASLMFFWLGLLCYNLIYWVRFDSAGVTVTEKTGLLWKFTIDMSAIFGDYPTTPYISLFLVLTVLFIPFTVYFLDQYLYARRLVKFGNREQMVNASPSNIRIKGKK